MILKELFKFLALSLKYCKIFIWNLFVTENKVLKLKMLEGQKALFHGYGDITRTLYSEQHLIGFQKSFEYDTLTLFQSILTKDAVVFDIGANIGLFSILASKHLVGQGKIYAFEPTTKTFEILKKNLKTNDIKNVSAHKIAFSDSESPVILEAPADKKNRYTDSFNRIKKADKNEKNDVIITCLLDHFVHNSKIDKIDVIKIDIEGAELLCFKGGADTLKRFRPHIIFEASELHCNVFEYSVFDVLNFLSNLGYNIRQLDQFQWIASSNEIKISKKVGSPSLMIELL